MSSPRPLPLKASFLTALFLVASLPAQAGPGLAIHADAVHVGDGTTLGPSTLLCKAGRIVAIAPRGQVSVPSGWTKRSCRVLLPGLVTGFVPSTWPEPGPVNASRHAVELLDPHEDFDSWLAKGVTALAVSPGRSRLVPGVGGIIRLDEDGSRRIHLRAGALHAVLGPGGLVPTATFEPHTNVSVDNPLVPAKIDRPVSPAAAMAELRNMLSAEAPPASVSALLAGTIPLRVHAHAEEDIRDALALSKRYGLRLVLEGGTESWKLASELADQDVLVLLTLAEPGLPNSTDASRGEHRPDTAAVLKAAGVPVAFGADSWVEEPDPLLLAAGAVRNGLSEELAIAAVTGLAARAMGAKDLGLIRTGAPADFAAFDSDPLALRSRPSFVAVAGALRFEEDGTKERRLIIQAGTLRSDGDLKRDVAVVLHGDKIASIEAGSAAPGRSEIHDFGPDAVIVPGFIDAWSHVGLEPGAPVGGSAKLRVADAIESDDSSLSRSLAAGLTASHTVPATSGSVRGWSTVVSTALQVPEDKDDDTPHVDVLSSAPGLVFWLDAGPLDPGMRAGRLRGLGGTLGKAKKYHDTWTAWEEKEKEGKPKAANGKKKQKKGASPLSGRKLDPRYSPGRAGRDAKAGKSSQKTKSKGKGEKKKEAPEKDPNLEPYRNLFKNDARTFVRAGRHDTIKDGLAAFKRVGLTPILVGGEEADLVADDLRRQGVTVILDPSLLALRDGVTVNVGAELRNSGVSVAFGSMGFGGEGRLPLAVARAVREGLSPGDALDGLTRTSAKAIGMEGKLGSLRPGRRGDLVVFSGDPFEPTSRVLAVVVRGELVHVWGDDLSATAIGGVGR